VTYQKYTAIGVKSLYKVEKLDQK